MLVIISTPEDAHLPFVTRHLEKDSYVVLDALEVALGKSLGFSIAGNGLEVLYRNKPLKNVTAVWVRRPSVYDEVFKLPIEERFWPYVHSSLKNHLRQLYTAFPGAYWISDEYAIRKANNKTWQLAVAAEIGFNVPDTLFTSDKLAAKKFKQKYRDIILKSQALDFPLTEDGSAQVYLAVRSPANEKLEFDGLNLAPSILQRAIDPAFDVRTTVIGDKVFSAKIELRGVKENVKQRDWRLGYVDGKLSISTFSLPEKITEQCVLLTKKLGLNFGAIDLVCDMSGQFWFLENNPNGQWAFIEEETGQQLGRAMADELMRSRKVYWFRVRSY